MPKQIVKFLMVGGAGFAAELVILSLLIYQFDVDKVYARLPSWWVAITITFVLNAKFTFLVRVMDAKMFRYVFIQLLGASINLGTYTLLVLYGPLVDLPLLALACGAGIATVSNFLLCRRFVYLDEARLDP